MSDHKTPLTDIERSGLMAHKLPVGKPSQLSDVFRLGIRYALDNDSMVKRIKQLEGDLQHTIDGRNEAWFKVEELMEDVEKLKKDSHSPVDLIPHIRREVERQLKELL